MADSVYYTVSPPGRVDPDILHAEITAANLPGYLGLTLPEGGGTTKVIFSALLSVPDKATLDAVVAAHAPPSLADADTARARDYAKALLDAGTDGAWKLVRAVALVALDEINVLREWEVSLQAAVAAATSLADLKTRIAALPSLGDRSAAQLKAAIRAKIDAGNAD